MTPTSGSRPASCCPPDLDTYRCETRFFDDSIRAGLERMPNDSRLECESRHSNCGFVSFQQRYRSVQAKAFKCPQIFAHGPGWAAQRRPVAASGHFGVALTTGDTVNRESVENYMSRFRSDTVPTGCAGVEIHPLPHLLLKTNPERHPKKQFSAIASKTRASCKTLWMRVLQEALPMSFQCQIGVSPHAELPCM